MPRGLKREVNFQSFYLEASCSNAQVSVKTSCSLEESWVCLFIWVPKLMKHLFQTAAGRLICNQTHRRLSRLKLFQLWEAWCQIIQIIQCYWFGFSDCLPINKMVSWVLRGWYFRKRYINTVCVLEPLQTEERSTVLLKADILWLISEIFSISKLHLFVENFRHWFFLKIRIFKENSRFLKNFFEHFLGI